MAEPGSSDRPDLPLAVVVGAGGLGIAVARRLGLSNRLLLADRDPEHLERSVRWLRSDGYDVTAGLCDVTDAADILHLARQAAASGPVRALAHVVGLSPAARDFRTIMAVNLVGAAMSAEAFRQVLAPGSCGLFVSSTAAYTLPVPEALWTLLDKPLEPGFLDALEAVLGEDATPAKAYNLSKAALNRMCRRLAPDWGAAALRIVSFSPGLIATPMGAQSYVVNPAKRELFDKLPLAREATVLEMSGLVEFLLSDRASYVTGTDLLADGGLQAAREATQG